MRGLSVIPVITISQGQSNGQHPFEAARHWVEQGARRLQIIDIDAAKGDKPNHQAITELVKSLRPHVELDLLLATHDDAALDAVGDLHGSNLVLTANALVDLEFTARAAEQHRIVPRLVVRDGGLLIATGTALDGTSLWDLLARLQQIPIAEYMFCDAVQHEHWWQDHYALLKAFLQQTGHPTVAGSGVRSMEDIHALAELAPMGLVGAVIGKALDEGDFTFVEAQTAAEARYDPYEWGPAQP